MIPNQPSKKFKLLPWIFAAFFSTFIIVDIAYIIIAEKTWRGMATEDGYQKGLKYNQTISAVKKQKELGWILQIKYNSSITKTGVLSVSLTDKNNQKITDANVTANFKRPLQEGKDFSVDLKFDAAKGVYNSTINFPLIGQWDIEVVARRDDKVYQDTKRLVIR